MASMRVAPPTIAADRPARQALCWCRAACSAKASGRAPSQVCACWPARRNDRVRMKDARIARTPTMRQMLAREQPVAMRGRPAVNDRNLKYGPRFFNRAMQTARCAVRSGQSRRINYRKAGMRPLCDTAQCPAHVTARFALPASAARNGHNGSVSTLSNRPARPASASWTSASRTGRTRSCGSAC